MNNLLLLPSAKLLPPELRVDFGELPSGMAPLNSRPALHYIAAPYAARGYQVVAAVHERGELVREYFSRHPELCARTVDVGPTGSLAETVAAALHSLGEMPDRLVINFADTLVEDELAGPDTICYREVEDLYRWTSFSFDESGRLGNLTDKDRLKPCQGPQPVFIGVFSFSRVPRLLELLEAVISRRPRNSDPFWSAVLDYYNEIPAADKRLQAVERWRDFGHLDTYYATQRSFFLGARHFNSMAVDLGRGVVRKSSRDAAKLAQEVRWYLGLPPGLQHLAPRVFDSRLEGESVFAEIEFYGYPALNDVYLYGDWDLGVWERALQAISAALDAMKSYRRPAAEAASRRRSLREMYEVKTIQRLRPLAADPRLGLFGRNRLRINGLECPGLKTCLAALPRILDRLGVLEDQEFTIVHGDLCLSNILYDRRNGFVRLIDPRGSFGGFDLYGDPRYDLAKLSHSFEGDYDFLVNGLFDLEATPEGFRLHPHLAARHQAVKSLFHAWLRRRAGAAYAQIRLIESLLFLSMVPLHADRPASQAAFLARGLELFERAARGSFLSPPPAPALGTPHDHQRDHHHGRER